MKIRYRWITALLIVLALVCWGHQTWYARTVSLFGTSQEGQFVEEAWRSQVYVITEDNWLEFRLPPRGNIVRVLTNAALREVPPPELRPRDPRPGWRYGIEYQLIDDNGQVLSHATYHFRAQLSEYRDVETGEQFVAALYGDTDLMPAGTRTMQFPMDRFEGRAQRLRLRLSNANPNVVEVGARVYCRQERPGYNKPYAWRRISQARRDKLCRASVYPPALLSAYERRNLLRWLWVPAPPIGLEGQHYRRRIMYTLQEIDGEEVGNDVPPVGQPVWPSLRAIVPVPPGDGIVRLECELVNPEDADAGAIPLRVRWYGRGTHERRTSDFEFYDVLETIELETRGGQLQIEAPKHVVVRSYWRSRSAASDSPFENITPENHYVRTYLTDTEHAVDYSITHADHRPTPFCVSLRQLLRPELALSGSELPIPAGPRMTVPVQWQFLDDRGEVVSEGQIYAEPQTSVYDRVYTATQETYITDPTAHYFAVPVGVHRVRLLGTGQAVFVAAYTRPSDLAGVMRIPEDYNDFVRRQGSGRIWYMMRPDDHLTLLEQDLSISIVIQPRPPEANEQLLAGQYEWQDYHPRGLWTARHLLVPRDPRVPVRDEARAVVFCEMDLDASHNVQFVRAPFQTQIQPRLICLTDGAAARTLRVMLDGRLYHSARLHASHTELLLPPLPAEALDGERKVRVEADKRVRVFMNHVDVPGRPVYLKSLAMRLTSGSLRFDYEKQSAGAEPLSLRVFRDQNHLGRLPLHVKIDPVAARSRGPSTSHTIMDRIFDLGDPERDDPTIVLGAAGQKVDSGSACYIPLGADLPPGRYTIDVRQPGGCEGYLVLSKTTPGIVTQRHMFLEDSFLEDGFLEDGVTTDGVNQSPE